MATKREYTCDGPECEKPPVTKEEEMDGWLNVATLIWDSSKYGSRDELENKVPHGSFCSAECLADWALDLEDARLDQGEEQPPDTRVRSGQYL
jgi:hypothetical protein